MDSYYTPIVILKRNHLRSLCIHFQKEHCVYHVWQLDFLMKQSLMNTSLNSFSLFKIA